MSDIHSHSGDVEGEEYSSSHELIPETVVNIDDLFETTNDEDDDDEDDGEFDDEDENDDNEDDEDEEEIDDDEFHDALDGEGGIEIVAEGEEDDSDGEEATPGQPQPFRLTRGQLMAFLNRQGLHGLFNVDGDDDEDNAGIWRSATRRREPPDPNRFPKVPSAEGRKLMESGTFGSIDCTVAKKRLLSRRILDRELGLGDRFARKKNQDLMAQQMIPSSEPEMIIHYPDPVCCGQFSNDGNFFYACVKDFKVRMYDTSNPYQWRYYKTVNYPFGQWTLTDADLSPDNKWLAYTSLQSSVCFAPTDPNDVGDPYALNLAGGASSQRVYRGGGGFAIFSVRFSGDGRTLVAGTGADSIIVYDIESRRILHDVHGHEQDVNAVCFADKLSPHILYSGSDDTTIKVWDTRSLGDGREAGAFVGHIEGLTYIDSKGDGRHILSNGKDQSMKLWDLRMAMSTARYEELDCMRVVRQRQSEYDYRWEDYDDDQWFQHKHDNSLVTFRGHKVQRTLIRCHFSPPGSTNSRYVYSGSQDGFVYVWNLDATLAAKIDVKAVTKGKQIGSRRYREQFDPVANRRGQWTTLVRDVGWHPNAPVLVASSWSGPSMGSGTATLHSFNESRSDEAEPAMGISLNEKLREDASILTMAEMENAWNR